MKLKKWMVLVFALALTTALTIPAIAAPANAPSFKSDFSQTISAGADHYLAIKTDGSLWEGDSCTVDGSSAPVKVMDGAVAAAAGSGFSLAIKTDGSLWTWGDNTFGQLGDGTTTDSSTPIKVMDNVTSVSAGGGHSLAIKTDGSLWAWGSNDSGQIGDGLGGNAADKYGDQIQTVPVKVMDGIKAISAGGSNSLAVKTDGSLWAWGSAYADQLANTIIDTPVKIMDGVASVSAGPFWYNLAVKTDGSLWAWGCNYWNQFGDTETVNGSSMPVKVMDGVTAAVTGKVSGASSSSDPFQLWIKSDGSLWDRESSLNPNLVSEGTPTNRDTPAKVMDNVAAVSAGSAFSLALTSDGSLW